MVECEFTLVAELITMINVLIDTWWNVNDVVRYDVLGLICFNRYMVECEYEHTPVLPKTFAVLIDTWWNVNDINSI